MSKTPEILWGATRQYKHNDGSDGFVLAFEQGETIKIVSQLESSIATLEREKAELEQKLAQEREANRWIPVTESLPKEKGLYLINFYDGVNTWFECCELCFTHSLVFFNNKLIKDGATHWMKTTEVK